MDLCCRVVVIDQITKDQPTCDSSVIEISDGMIRAWRTELPGTVRPVTVVILDVLSQNIL